VAQNFRSIELSLPQVGQNIAESPPGTSASNTNVIAFEMHKSSIAHKCPITMRVSDGTVNARESIPPEKTRQSETPDNLPAVEIYLDNSNSNN
jgi:hypothetical protein